MTPEPRPLELLAPARDAEIARQAILHGADAVYIGASSHGARSAASNRIEDIARLVGFAHSYGVRIYVTVNTVIYPDEVEQVRDLVRQLYRAGADAIIVQDMALLEMDIPPIELHASTQCDISSVGKAVFLEQAGFSQLVLARELTVAEISDITSHVSVPVECFVHGALCVSYSGRCHASLACGGRSANRGECAQMCRLPYTLADGKGNIISRDKYLLSMHDLNATAQLEKLVQAGVSSFKIEGRLKDAAYVKNITAWYRRRLDAIIAAEPDKYRRSSYGASTLTFIPDPVKSFNRGYTDFSLSRDRNPSLASVDTPKSMGEPVTDISMLNNGDGVSWMENGRYTGTRINRVERGRIITADRRRVPLHGLRRTFNVQWEQEMSRRSATRRIAVDMSLYGNRLALTDERGAAATVAFDFTAQTARTPQNRRPQFERLGDTIYTLRDFNDHIGNEVFIPNSMLAELRRRGIAALERAARATYRYGYRRNENTTARYPADTLDYRDNVANPYAERFYRRHGVKTIEPAAEVSGVSLTGRTVMTSRHCILRQLGMCLRTDGKNMKLPLTLTGGGNTFILDMDCRKCEMRVIKR